MVCPTKLHLFRIFTNLAYKSASPSATTRLMEMLRQIPMQVTWYVVWFPLVADAMFSAEMKIITKCTILHTELMYVIFYSWRMVQLSAIKRCQKYLFIWTIGTIWRIPIHKHNLAILSMYSKTVKETIHIFVFECFRT